MMVTIQRIMELSIIQERAVLLAGKGGMARSISFVTIMEAPDFYEWVSGGEFILTSWYAFSQNPAPQRRAFIEMAKRGIAGIAIKINRYIDAVPAEILKIADQYNVPVFSIQRETKFREIVQAISAEIHNYQTNILLEVDKQYHQLVETALSEDGFEPMLRVFGRKRRCNSLCMTDLFEIVGLYEHPGRKIAADQFVRIMAADLAERKERAAYRQIADFHAFSCVARGCVLGYLLIMDSESLSEKYQLMAQQLTTFLTLKLVERVESEQKVLNNLLDDILFTHTYGENELRDRLRRAGMAMQGGYRVVILAGLRRARQGNPPNLREHAVKVKNMMKDALLIERQDEMVLLAAEKAGDGRTRELEWLKPLQAYLRLYRDDVLAGVGPATAAAAEVKTSYEMAKRTIGIGLAQSAAGVLYFREYLTQAYLYHGMDAPERRYIIENIIGALRGHDQKYNADLLATLRKAAFCGGIEKLAEEMHVHVNTVRYRMRKICEITGLDFFHARDRYVLTTAVLLYTYEQAAARAADRR